MTKSDFDAARAQYDATQGQLQAARATTSEAEIALRDTSVAAPFDVDIVKKNVELGAFVGPGSPVLELAKTDVVKIVIGVPDTTLRSIKLGQRVDVAVDAFADRTFQARISRIASAADPKTRNFEVEIAIPNRDRALKVGMIGSLHLATEAANTAADAAGAVVRDRSGGRWEVRRLHCRALAGWRHSQTASSRDRTRHWYRDQRRQWVGKSATK